MNKISISDINQIRAILDYIHDRWFNIGDIIFNPQLSNLEIKFNREETERKELVKRLLVFKKWKLPIIESKLRINYVKNYNIEDKARIGGSDFNVIKFNEKQRTIIITCGVPFEIRINVERFQIELEDTKNVIEQKEYWSLF